jgi:hypothetical protein
VPSQGFNAVNRTVKNCLLELVNIVLVKNDSERRLQKVILQAGVRSQVCVPISNATHVFKTHELCRSSADCLQTVCRLSAVCSRRVRILQTQKHLQKSLCVNFACVQTADCSQLVRRSAKVRTYRLVLSLPGKSNTSKTGPQSQD